MTLTSDFGLFSITRCDDEEKKKLRIWQRRQVKRVCRDLLVIVPVICLIVCIGCLRLQFWVFEATCAEKKSQNFRGVVIDIFLFLEMESFG